MRIDRFLLATAAAALATATPAGAQRPDAEADVSLGKISNQFICTFDQAMPGPQVRNEAAKAAGPVLGQVLHTYDTAVKGFAVRVAARSDGRSPVAEMRRANPRIASCEQDQVMKALGKPTPAGETTPTGINVVGGSVDMSGSGKTAWVLDSGIDLDHPDLNVDVGRSVSFVSSTPDDRNGHGTHVAGTIGAIDNNIGVVGVAAGVTLVAVQVLGASGSGSTSGVIAGVEHVMENGSNGDVANMSLGGGFSQALNTAVENAAARGIAFALSAGNEGIDAASRSPASADGSNIDTVAAVNNSGTLASWSNYGADVDIAEPGVSVRSTYKGGGYATMSGTSMAAPHRAGLLLLSGGLKTCGSSTADPNGDTYGIGCH